jgi:glycogen debranching enzyme
MDAKVDDWVVTPRRGKAVEINALWYNALQLMEAWAKDRRRARGYADHAARARDAFNRRFWFAAGRYSTTSSTPNAATRRRGRRCEMPAESGAGDLTGSPVLDPSRWQPVMHAVSTGS